MGARRRRRRPAHVGVAPGISPYGGTNMKLKLSVAALAAAGMLVGAAVHAQDSDTDRSHPQAFVKDSVITTKIKSKLATEHITSLAHIRVDTDKDGVVWL